MIIFRLLICYNTETKSLLFYKKSKVSSITKPKKRNCDRFPSLLQKQRACFSITKLNLYYKSKAYFSITKVNFPFSITTTKKRNCYRVTSPFILQYKKQPPSLLQKQLPVLPKKSLSSATKTKSLLHYKKTVSSIKKQRISFVTKTRSPLLQKT